MGYFPGQSAFRRQTGWERDKCTPGRCSEGWRWGGVELWPRFPTPLLGSWKKSSLIGSLAVSFTLNIKVKHKSQASVLAKEGRACSSSLGWDRGPPRAGTAFSHSPALWALPAGSIHTKTQVLCGPGRSPLCWPSRACVPITPTQTALLQSKQINAMGRANTPTPKSQTSSSCPILFSRLKNKIQTIGEQQSQAALGSTRTRGLCTTIR